jgi:hypothetical protein
VRRWYLFQTVVLLRCIKGAGKTAIIIGLILQTKGKKASPPGLAAVKFRKCIGEAIEPCDQQLHLCTPLSLKVLLRVLSSHLS